MPHSDLFPVGFSSAMKTIIHFDCESTGLSITTDRIIQLSLIKTDLEFNILEKKKLLLSNCGVPIHEDAVKAHGITETMLEGKPSFKNYANTVFQYLNQADYLSGYNIKGFDVPLLYEEFFRAGINNWEPKPIIDSCIIFKQREKRTLEAAMKIYCGKELEGAHDAENDVVASIEVLKGQINKYDFNIPEIGEEETSENIINTVIKESSYEEKETKLSWDGKIILLNSVPCWGNFGKNKFQPVKNDLGYCDWVLSSDFSSQTKNVLRNILNTQ